MSLFGSNQSGGLFGNTQNKSSLFGGLNTNTTGTQQNQQTQQSGGSSLFGNTQNKPATGGLFGSTQNQSSGGGSLFGNTATQNKPATGGLFGSTQNQQTGGTGTGLFGTSTSQPQQTGGGLFGTANKTQTQPQTSLFGQTTQTQNQQQTGGGLFGSTTQQKPQGGLFGGTLGQSQPQQSGGLFTSTSNAQQPSLFGGAQQAQQQQQQPQLGQSVNQQLGSTLWTPGRGITGVHRTVPMQMTIVKDKWDPTVRTSPFRTYLYNYVGEDQAPFYQPGPDDDETKWEDALRERPGPGYVPVLVKGYWELGKRAQRQKDFLAMLQTRLHEINTCLTDLLSRHELKISVKIADCRRRHQVLSHRCLALAAKTQILRNRGYAMDDAEEELKKKLAQLERNVFDPSITGRAEEIWARMLAIREHSRRLQDEMERVGFGSSDADETLNENVIKTAKKILEDYASQIQHLQKELENLQKEVDEAQQATGHSGN